MTSRIPSVLPIVAALLISSCAPVGAPAPDQPQVSEARDRGTDESLTAVHRIDLELALGWRQKYADLLGKPKEAGIERFGPPDRIEYGDTLSWKASPKTDERAVTIMLATHGNRSEIDHVKVFARATESVDPLDILKKAPLFTFETGTFQDTLKNYFVAETKDGRNDFQFDVGENEIVFRAMIFSSGDKKP